MKLAVPDLVSNSYFPAIAAVSLGFFAREGLDVDLELTVPIEQAMDGMKQGTVDFIGCSAHLVVAGFPEWHGAKLLCAQAQGMYWFLVMRADLTAKRGDLGAVKGRRIGAAHWVAMGLRKLLEEAGIDIARDQVDLGPIPGAHGAGTNFGVAAAKALEEGRVDGFWANGMGAELAVRHGVGTIVYDARRDDPTGAQAYTWPSLMASDALIGERPQAAAAAVRAVVKAQAALREDVALAGKVGRKLFPPEEADLIVDLVRRDLPYYHAAITPEAVARMVAFSRALDILSREPRYEEIVATELQPLWAA